MLCIGRSAGVHINCEAHFLRRHVTAKARNTRLAAHWQQKMLGAHFSVWQVSPDLSVRQGQTQQHDLTVIAVSPADSPVIAAWLSAAYVSW